MELLFENWRRYLNEIKINIFPRPKAFVIPHASPEYSGHVALELIKTIPAYDYDSILLLGIDHEGGPSGIYAGSEYNPDEEKIAALRAAGFRDVEGDHSIGNILPLIESFTDLPIAPVVITNYSSKFSEILKTLITGRTLIIASTDLSHYNPLEEAGQIDHETIAGMQNEDPNLDACGRDAIRTLYDLIDDKLELVDYDTSAHLEGDTEKVVGYAALQAGGFSEELLNARDAVKSFCWNNEKWRASRIDGAN
jgi:AmmeMemoRadiSam system protein B